MPDEDKPETADALMRAIELELAQKRRGWEREREKFRTLRLLSFSFVSLVILGVLLALFVFFSRAGEMRNQRSRPAVEVASPHSSP